MTNPVARREAFLLRVYADNSGVAYSLKRHRLKERASRLLDETRRRYGTLPTMTNVDLNLKTN